MLQRQVLPTRGGDGVHCKGLRSLDQPFDSAGNAGPAAAAASMCGIAGLWDRRAAGAGGDADLLGQARTMADALAHRGPDGEGLWADAAAGLAFGHRRLAIIDLSPAAAQPMVSACGRYVICYNGEIYNYRELAAELAADGRRFQSQCDTEVILEACAAWGVARAVPRFIGMFAFALWDRQQRRLTLVRDRLGIKPLYWGRFGELLLFGSELKALRAASGFQPELDRGAAAAFMRHGYVPAPHSIYRGVAKLEPGCMLTLAEGGAPVIERYWDLRQVALTGLAQRHAWDPDAAVQQLETLLRDAVRQRLIADVPLGAFLSGGVDSSTVVALMQAESRRPVKSFSIGFANQAYDESADASRVAAYLGTEHTELRVSADHALAVIPKLADYYDEPFADSSQIPTYLVAEMSRGQVTVALSGDGGDEVFAGYNRYIWADRLWRRLCLLPLPLRRAAAGLLRALPPQGWDRLLTPLPAKLLPRQAGDKLHKLAGLLGVDSRSALYRRLVSQWPDPAALLPGAAEPRGLLWDASLEGDIPDFVERMQFLDTATYLPDDILTKVDRASMAVGLEARVPLIDHRVVEFAWSLPLDLKLRGGVGKHLLRQVLYRHVPRALIDRPKLGFGVPIGDWLRGPLRDWAEDLLDERRLAQGGVIDPAPVRRLWAEHLAGRCNGQHPLWCVLMYQAWATRWGMAA